MFTIIRNKLTAYKSQIFAVQLPQKVAMQQIFVQITRSLTAAFKEPEMKKMMESLTVQALLNKSVEYYVGSRSTPRNQSVMQMLLQKAQKKAQAQANQKLINLVKYYYSYYIKMGALKDGNQAQYNRSSQMFMQLAQKGLPLANYLVGKQMYKMVQSGQMSSWKDQKVQNQARQVFTNSLCGQQYGGLYYVADVYQRFRYQKDITDDSQRMLFQLYSQAASLGYALAYFKIALLYKRNKNYKLYKKYLIQASEAGVIQAQHNLGIEYTKGQHFAKDDIKAFAWFTQASAFGFIYSKYNLSRILADGSSCGRLKPNPKASLVYLQQINRSGQLDVSKQIEKMLQKIQKK